mgnify:CR=1 FL=1
MNVCMGATFKCSWGNMIAKLKANIASASYAHTGWTVAKEGENVILFMD